MLTVFIFIVILGLLVFVHELGHFLVAKKHGVKVEEFGFGFPPRIWGIRRGGTMYSVNWIPLGGFVKILGEDGEEKENPYSFSHKKIWQRGTILAAGVSMNIILAIVLASLGYVIGLPTAIDDSQGAAGAQVQIVAVADGSPAASAGIKAGDMVVSLQGSDYQAEEIGKMVDFQEFVSRHKGQEILLYLRRGQQVFAVKATPRVNSPNGEGPLGVALARVVIQSYSWQRAIFEGGAAVFNLVWAILAGLGYLLWQLVWHTRVVGELTGPVGIFSLTGQAAQLGFVYLLQLTVILSVNLAIVNIMPWPALDGGRLLFLLIEKIKGKPIKQTLERAINTVGFVLLILLMVLITLRDVIKIF
ncbi:MAG: RIP metalloprotease RseP [Candidatus Portnoybacteria bacterium]|jgi:regulator of sigma E protease|nr:RIP metalloprotease RseP [Candidatus Portnoybacteria bacterium]